MLNATMVNRLIILCSLTSLLSFCCKDNPLPGSAGLNVVPLPANEFLDALQFVDESTGWLLSNARGDPSVLHLYRTDDGGRHWGLQITPDSSASEAISFSGRLNGWVGSLGGKLFSTSDGGNSWKERSMDSLRYRLYDIQSLNEAEAWVTGWRSLSSSYIFQTTNKGLSWTKRYDNLYMY